jgi:hypothetical protein
MIKFSTRRSGRVVQVCVTRCVKQQNVMSFFPLSNSSDKLFIICSVNSLHFKIDFDFPLIKSINKFHKTFRMDELSPDLDFPDFIRYVIWNEMDELFDNF